MEFLKLMWQREENRGEEEIPGESPRPDGGVCQRMSVV